LDALQFTYRFFLEIVNDLIIPNVKTCPS
jgi:hypothetical protein